MKDRRNKFYQYAAAYLVSKSIKFTYSGEYISCSIFDLSNDFSDRTKVWINEGDEWHDFTNLDSFTNWLKRNI